MNELASNWLEHCLSWIPKGRVTVFGDFCLDSYWLIDPDDSELSVETGLSVRRVRSQRYSLGGAGNVAANLAAIGTGKVRAVSLVGDDLFGRQLQALLIALGIDAAGVLACQEDWQTLVYSKPCIGATELNRIDFGAFNEVSPAAIDALARALDRAAGESDAVILNQQVPSGVSSPAMIERVNAVVAAHPGCRFIVDSRHRAELYHGAILKLNAHEAAHVLGQDCPLDQAIRTAQAGELARRLRERTGQPVFLTRGQAGLLVADESGLHEIPGIHVPPPVDPVGAGDTVVSALAAVLAVGGAPLEAATLANIAASVTVKKLQTTGTASPDEIRAIGPAPDYIYQPELAEDPCQARYLHGTRIEVVGQDTPKQTARLGVAPKHVIFDHDGTISTLREGWDTIMEPMMIRCILGPRQADAGPALRDSVTQRVRDLIEQTTGKQTLVQMQGLVEMIRQYGLVPPEEVLDLHGYKAVYNRELMALVRARMERLERGEVQVRDFLIPGALEFLRALHGRGIKLYLASGTDQEDVQAEARLLGYADLFEEIAGSVGDVRVEVKQAVMESILREHALEGPEVAIVGDGPVEMRLARRHGALAIGVASDEIHPGRLNAFKRRRLIRAGADYVVEDFREGEALMGVLQ